jgi:bla regulator protein blaR1
MDEFDVRGVTLAELSVSLSRRLDRDIIDKTGIAGKFDIRVALTPGLAGLLLAPPPPPPPGGAAAPPLPPAAAPPNPTDPSDVFDATQTLVEKLGLRLESTKGPGRFLVIDHVERPSAN